MSEDKTPRNGPGTDEIIEFPFATAGRIKVLLAVLNGEIGGDTMEALKMERKENMQTYAN